MIKRMIIFLSFLIMFSGIVFAQADVWYAKGEQALYNKKFDDAIEFFTRVFDFDPNNQDAYFNRGLAYMYSQKMNKALADFNKALQLNPNDADFYNARGLAYGYIGNVDKAISDFDKAIQLDDKFTEAYLNRGSAYSSIRNYPKARKDFDKVLKIDSKNPAVYFQRGTINYKLANYKKAVADFTKAIKFGLNKVAKVFYNRGNSYFRLKNYKSAIKDYSECIKLNPDDTEAMNNRAMAYDLSGNKKMAQKDRDKLNEISGGMFPDFKTLKYKRYSDTPGKVSLELPEKWFFLKNDYKNVNEYIVSVEKIQKSNDPYTAGVKVAVNKDMERFTDDTSPQSLIDFWTGSQLKNAEDYVTYDVYTQKQFRKYGYHCVLNEVQIQITDDDVPMRIYELAMAKDNLLIFAYFQAFITQWGYYKKIFDKAIKTMVVK